MTAVARSAVRSALLLAIALTVRVIGPARRLLRPRVQPGTRQFLLIRLDLLGDVAFSLSAIRALKESTPDSEITMVTLPQTAGLARLCRDVDHVIEIDTNRIRSPRTLLQGGTVREIVRAVHHIRQTRFDAAISLSGRTASLLALAAKAQTRVGYADEAYAGSLDQAVEGGRYDNPCRVHDVVLSRRLVARTVPTSMLTDAVSTPNFSDREVSAGFFEKVGVVLNDEFVVIHAGSSYGDFKRWPADRFRDLIRLLSSSNVRSVLVGGRQDAEIAAEIAGKTDAISLAGETSLAELVALLRRASAVISADSGPLHIAAAVGTPVVGLYGPTDPAVNGPIGFREQRVAVVRADIACSPCYSVRTRAECPLGHPICMHLIDPHTVADAVMAVMAGATQRPDSPS